MSSRRRWLALLFGSLVLYTPVTAFALPQVDWKTRAAARTLGVEGLQLMRQEEWEEAYDKLERAYKLYSVPTLGLATARCLEKLGRLVEAAERYREVGATKVERSDGFQQNSAVKAAQQERAILLPRIPSLEVMVRGDRGDGLEVLVDTEILPPELVDTAHPVDPGEHEVRVRRGDVTITESATLEEGETARVVVKLPDLPLPPLPPKKGTDWTPFVWGGFGIGGGGLLTAIINGSVAIRLRGTLRDRCAPDGICPPTAHDVVDGYDAARYATTVGFVLAGVGVAAGCVFFFLDDDADQIGVGPTGLQLRF